MQIELNAQQLVYWTRVWPSKETETQEKTNSQDDSFLTSRFLYVSVFIVVDAAVTVFFCLSSFNSPINY